MSCKDYLATQENENIKYFTTTKKYPPDDSFGRVSRVDITSGVPGTELLQPKLIFLFALIGF